MAAASIQAERLRRFLAPAHALPAADDRCWQARGAADTPAADAACELYLAIEAGQVADAAFTLFGPPIAVCCADWLCEVLIGRTMNHIRGLSVQDMERALALAPDERYAALLVIDALANAGVNLGS